MFASSASLFTLALFATSVLAAPRSNLARRVDGRQRATRPPQNVEGRVLQSTQGSADTQAVTFSSNWAGAVYTSGGPYTFVTGTFTVPTPLSTDNSSSAGTQSASAWVGIDGDTCGSAILQTGVDFNVDAAGKVSYDSWYEWFPDYAHDFTGITFAAGDSVTLTVNATSTTSGVAIITNNSNGQTVSKYLSAPDATTDKLCEANAEWIVEDFEENGSLVPLVNFGTVVFTNAYALTSTGATITPESADLLAIRQSGVVHTQVSADSSSVTVQYI